MKEIFHKVIILCQYINAEVNLLLAYLVAWIVVLLDHVATLFAYSRLHLAFLN